MTRSQRLSTTLNQAFLYKLCNSPLEAEWRKAGGLSLLEEMYRRPRNFNHHNADQSMCATVELHST